MKLNGFFYIFWFLVLSYSPYALSMQDGGAVTESFETERLTAQKDSTKSISNGRYMGGGIVSVFPG